MSFLLRILCFSSCVLWISYGEASKKTDPIQEDSQNLSSVCQNLHDEKYFPKKKKGSNRTARMMTPEERKAFDTRKNQNKSEYKPN